MKKSENENSWREILELYGSTSGFFAIAKAFSYYKRGKQIQFIIWCLITIVFLGITTKLMLQLKRDFDSSPFTTKIQYKNNVTLPFPRVLICKDVSLGDLPSRQKYNFSEDQFSYLLAFQLEKAGTPVNFTLDNRLLLELWYHQLKANTTDFDLRKFIYNLLYIPCDQFFTHPVLMEMGVAVVDVCNRQFHPLMSDRGFCRLLRFDAPIENSTEMKRLPQVTPGVAGGLQFFLGNPGDFAYYTIYIGSEHTPASENPIVLSSGQSVYISMVGKMIRRNPDYDNCTTQTRTKWFPYYRQKTCVYECMVENLRDTCGCLRVGFNITNPNHTKWCEPDDYFRCYQAYMNLEPEMYKPRLVKCTDICKPLCSKWEIYATPSYRRLDKGQAKFRMFYENLSYEDVTNVNLLTLEGILGSVGGIMGFWFGSSLLSVLHLFTWLGELLHFSLRKLFCHNAQ